MAISTPHPLGMSSFRRSAYAFLVGALLLGGAAPRALEAAPPPERLHYPQQAKGFAGGWDVSPEKGQLGIVMPAAMVPGDIPIPAVYRYNGAWSRANQGYLVLKENVKTGVESWSSYTGTFDFPLSGQFHLGLIFPQAGWVPPDKGAYPSNPTWAQEANYWVLEDGTEFTSADFGGTVALSSSLYTAFGLGSVSSAVNVDSTGGVAFYSATAAQLGTWQTSVTNLTTGSMFNNSAVMGPVGYQVVMSRDLARVYAFNYTFNVWVPVLWLDRFGHSVTFQWGMSASAPSGYSNVYYVKALNSLGKGFQAQWVTTSTQSPVPLFRLDFINVQAPTLQVTGYSGFPAKQPAALGGAAANVLGATDFLPIRPTEVRVGQPGTGTVPTPSWMSVGLPQPSQSTFTEAWPADRAWTFTYDANQAELSTMNDPLGVSTTFSWTTTNLYSFVYGTTNLFRSLSSAASTDSRTGITLTKTYTWSLPTTSTGTWTTTFSQAYSGTGVLPAATQANTTTYTFAPAGNPN